MLGTFGQTTNSYVFLTEKLYKPKINHRTLMWFLELQSRQMQKDQYLDTCSSVRIENYRNIYVCERSLTFFAEQSTEGFFYWFHL